MDYIILAFTIIVIGLLLGIMIGAAWYSYRLQNNSQDSSLGGLPGSGIVGAISSKSKRRFWWSDWFKGVSTEMAGAVLTTIFLGIVLSLVQDYREQENRKGILILQMGSPNNSFAIEAARQLGILRWLSDGSLENANLSSANLINVDLQWANLKAANLFKTQLNNSDLRNINLESADLSWAHISNSTLEWANLKGSNLKNADLSGVNLTSANLENAILVDTIFDENVILPDGLNWEATIDMSRFTDQFHPQFWRPSTEQNIWWFNAF